MRSSSPIRRGLASIGLVASLTLGCAHAPCPATVSAAGGANGGSSPYTGAYNIDQIRNSAGETIDVQSRLTSTPGSLGARMAWVFDGETLRMQILAVTRLGDGSLGGTSGELFEVCDVSLSVGIAWDGDTVQIPTAASARGREHVLAFEAGADEEWSTVGDAWTDRTDSCDVSVARMRVRLRPADDELTEGGRPLRLLGERLADDGSVLESYALVAAAPNEDLDIEEEVARLRGE